MANPRIATGARSRDGHRVPTHPDPVRRRCGRAQHRLRRGRPHLDEWDGHVAMVVGNGVMIAESGTASRRLTR